MLIFFLGGGRSPLHVIIAQMGRHNALLVSQTNLARVAGCSVRTLTRALSVLREQNWIEVRQIGPTGTVCAYIVNDRVAWSGKRDGIRYSLFSAAVLASDDEQPDRDEIGSQPPVGDNPNTTSRRTTASDWRRITPAVRAVIAGYGAGLTGSEALTAPCQTGKLL